MPPGRCARLSTPEQVDAAAAAGRMHPGDGVEVKKFMAYLRDVAAGVKAGMDRDAARAAAPARHYPDDYARLVRAEDDAVEDLHPRETGGGPPGEEAGNP